MDYDLFLFDADDTLFDFEKSERETLKSTFNFFGASTGFEEIYQTYRSESLLLWQSFELGEITKDHLQLERFRLTSAAHNLNLCSEELNSHYLKHLQEQVHLNKHAFRICKYLSKNRRVGIVTNGVEMVQMRRLQKSGLSPFIECMVVSEECGYSKPDVRFFQHAMAKFRGSTNSRTLVIGDRLEVDIQGAHAYGLDACWYNPQQRVSNLEIQPKYEIACLSELEI